MFCVSVGPRVLAKTGHKNNAQENSNIDPDAMEALNKMGVYLRSLKAFQVDSEVTNDEVLDDGEIITDTRTNTVLPRGDCDRMVTAAATVAPSAVVAAVVATVVVGIDVDIAINVYVLVYVDVSVYVGVLIVVSVDAAVGAAAHVVIVVPSTMSLR